MHAVRLHEFGPATNLRWEETPDPTPGPGLVRIAVTAAGVHLVDTSIRSGQAGGPLPLPDLPAVPGREVAGVVDVVGDGVDPSWLGRRVVAHLGATGAGYAELAVCDAGSLHAVPDGVADDAAVAMIGTGRTTMAILEVAALRPDDVVLVTAAAGGIGSLLVQAAKAVGAFVVGLAGGPAKVELVASLGADVAVDYRAPAWPAEVTKATADLGRDLTIVLDGVGGASGRTALDLLGIGGRIVLFGWSAGEPLELSVADLYAKSLTASVAIGPRILRRPGGLRDLEDQALYALATGRLVPRVQRFPMADAAAAHTALEARATTGKVVLVL